MYIYSRIRYLCFGVLVVIFSFCNLFFVFVCVSSSVFYLLVSVCIWFWFSFASTVYTAWNRLRFRTPTNDAHIFGHCSLFQFEHRTPLWYSNMGFGLCFLCGIIFISYLTSKQHSWGKGKRIVSVYSSAEATVCIKKILVLSRSRVIENRKPQILRIICVRLRLDMYCMSTKKVSYE